MPAGSEIRSVVLAAAGSNAHVFQDSFLRVIGARGAMVGIAAVTTAATTMSVQSGSRTVTKDSILSVSAGTTNPNLDSDKVVSFPAAPGEEIFVSIASTPGSTTRILLVVAE